MKSILLLSTLASLTLSAHAADWPHWRGPDRIGISSEKSIQTQWKNDEPAILWKANVGTGYSAISIANGSVVTLGNDAGKETVYCFDEATGKEKWKHTYDSPLAPKYFPGGPTSTPTIDGAHVYTLSREGQLFCFDLTTGKVVWAENPAKDNEMSKPEWGFSGSPMILGDRLYLNVGDAGMALNKKDGSVIWKSGTGAAGYSTLLPMNHSAKTALLLGSAKS